MHLIFTQPGDHLSEHPCILNAIYSYLNHTTSLNDCPDHHQPGQQAEAGHAAQVRGRPQEALREGGGRAPRLLDGRR